MNKKEDKNNTQKQLKKNIEALKEGEKALEKAIKLLKILDK